VHTEIIAKAEARCEIRILEETCLTPKDQIVFRPVGVVRTNASEADIKSKKDETESVIEIYPEFEEGLEGLAGYSHIFVLSYLHKLRPDQIGPLKVKPRRLLQKGFKPEEIPEVGVFALDSPTRPNPISLSLVKVACVVETRTLVNGLDLFNGTPVLDIKPYRGDYKADSFELPEWYRTIHRRLGEDI
jgi:tRNA-Thr(GGU) m(6)t(6)A37 methyltransferase TsaA